jgi:hypothetical protein
MNTVLWILAGVLAVAFMAGGVMKLSQPRAKLATSGMGFVEDFSDGAVKSIGVLEILAAMGLVAPAYFDVAPILVPLAAVGVIMLMVGAMVTHARRGERQPIVANVVFLALAAVVAWGRLGPESFTG